MDADGWSSCLAAAKRQYALQNHNQTSLLDRLGIDDFEVEDDGRPDYPCPYCYEEFDVAALCAHLEDEHPCESKVTVCPICMVKVARDMLSHITLQHRQLFRLQRCRRLRKAAISNNQTMSLLGRDLREAHLQVLLGHGGHLINDASVSNASVDPFLSTLVLSLSTSEAEEISKSVGHSAAEISVKDEKPTHIWKLSFDPSLSREEREKRMRQAAGRAGYMQDLLLSTLFLD